MTNLFFFHTTDDYIETFDPQYSPMNKDTNPPARPLFYWFSNVYFKYLGDKYLYLFIINPKKQGVAVRNRAENERQFDGLWNQYQDFQLRKRDKKIKYNEPPIIMSFAKLKPSLTLKHLGNGVFTVMTPVKGFRFFWQSKNRTIKFKMLDENNQKIPFNKIEPLMQLLPELKNSLPFTEPKEENDKFVYEDWLEMVTEKNGSWL